MLRTVHTVIVVGDGDLAPLAASGKTVLRYAETGGRNVPEFDWPDLVETYAAAYVLHQRHHAGIRKALPTATVRAICTRRW